VQPIANTAANTTASTDKLYQDLAQQFPLPRRTLPALLETRARRYGERTLYQCGADTSQSVSYRQAVRVAQSWAHVLQSWGVRTGDRVALLCANRIEFLHVFLGCAWMGAVCVPINTASKGAQLQHILHNCAARLMVVDSSLTTSVQALDVSVYVLDDADVLGADSQTLSHAASALQWHSVPATLPVAGESTLAPANLQPGDTLAILYTSGTTGPSKGVCCPHAQFFWWGLNTAELLEINGNRGDEHAGGEVLYSCLPLFHINALCTVVQALLTGATFIIGPRFSASRFLVELVQHRASVTYLLGAMVPMLLARNPTAPPAGLRTRVALAPGVPAAHHQEFVRRFGIGLVSGFGSTESNFVIGETLADTVPGLMGRVRPGFEARVVDELDAPVPAGTAGELLLRAKEPYAFASGYYSMAEQTVAAWQNLWFHTGDRVVCDENGRMRFLDRMKDAIRRRGENISAFEVEAVLNQHPDVALSAVFAVPSDLGEDEVMAAIVWQYAIGPDSKEGEEENGQTRRFAALLHYCANHLPYFAVPRYFEALAELPVTENGKVQKFKLRERGLTAQTWDRSLHGINVTRNGVVSLNPDT